MEFRRLIREFFNYACFSPLATLYKLAAGNAPLDAVREAFSKLPVAIQHPLYENVWREADCPGSHSGWSEHHIFTDMPRFHRALKKCITRSFDALRPEEKTVVYERVFQLAERQGVLVEYDDPDWGKTHAFDNILRLIDAMTL
jgi:hypothetical protein